MVRLLKRRYKKAGLSASVQNHEEPLPGIRLSLFEYSKDTFIEQEDTALDVCLRHLETPSITWIQVYGVDNQTIEQISHHFKVHPLAIEDILSTHQRAKLDVYENQLFIVIRSLKWQEKPKELISDQVSLVVGPNYLISFSERDLPLFDSIKQHLRNPNSRMRMQGSDYLAYNILDQVVDQYFVVLESIDDRLEKLENDLMHPPSSEIVTKIQNAKRSMIFLRRSIWPIREVISRLQHLDSPLISSNTRVYLNDVYDHVVQVIDIIEGFRDVVSGMLDIYLSNINMRTNDIIKFLTIVSTIFVPLTFVSSVYGMNFDYLPELHYWWAYPALWGVMITMAVSMLFYFHRKKWL